MTTRDRFLGCILGSAVGDATGAPFEGVPATAIWYDLGGAHKLIQNPPVDVLTYTDDTQMSIGVAETLVSCGRIDAEILSSRFASNYDPERCYGPGARRVIEAIASGGDAKGIAETIFPGGSLGNGAAMRVAPVGLFFHKDLDRLADEATLSAMPTHLHPVGIDGARIMALAVALVMREAPFDANEFFQTLISYAATEEFRAQLERAATLQASDGVGCLGNNLAAHQSVVTAIAAFALSGEDYTRSIASAIALGGDVDTLAAMAGGLAGARLGISAIPRHLLDRLENGPRGRDFLFSLADELYRKFEGSQKSQ